MTMPRGACPPRSARREPFSKTKPKFSDPGIDLHWLPLHVVRRQHLVYREVNAAFANLRKTEPARCRITFRLVCRRLSLARKNNMLRFPKIIPRAAAGAALFV